MAKSSGPLIVVAGAAALLLMGGKKKRKKSSSNTGADPSAVTDPAADPIKLKADKGPESDPCVAELYSQTATSLAPELAQNISPKANSIYGEGRVFFISHSAQLEAFEKLATFMVNNPAREDAVSVVAADMAPNCDWSKEDGSTPGAQLAFYDSIGKMAQVISADLPEGVGHPHPWENNIPVLTDIDLVVGDTSLVGVLLPDDWGDCSVDARPLEDMLDVESIGLTSQKVEVSPDVYQYKPLYLIRPIMGPVGKQHKSIKIRITVRCGTRSFRAGDLIVERDPSLG